MSTGQRGLTLIELLIVIGIVAMTTLLVIPDVQSMLKRGASQNERAMFRSLTRRLSAEAFLTGRPLEITASGSELQWRFFGGDEGSYNFENLVFEKSQIVQVSDKGLPFPHYITAVVGGDEERVYLGPESAEIK